ncbi:efflux RND transporter permease subunit, partial [Brevibacterium sp. SIMBA_078]
MLNLLIKFSLTQRLFVSIFAIIAMVIGARSWLSIPVDAFPEISPTQVK